MRWRCRLLGGLSLESDGRRIERFRTEKTALLLGYLAYYAGEWFGRVTLADMFWGDGRDPDASLRTALSSLRKQLEPAGVPTGGVLQTAGNRIRLNPDALETDVAEFQALLRTARCHDDPAQYVDALVNALRLYRGELLQGYEAEWLLPLRTQLEREYLQALRAALPELLRIGRVAVARELAERAVRIYPLSETASEWLIRLYLSIGAEAQAEAEYQRLRGELARALGDYPRFTLESLRGALLEVNPSPHLPDESPCAAVSSVRPRAAVPAPLTRFFGREAELEQAASLLRNGARLITITGAPGIGKTRFGQELGLRLEATYAGRVFWIPLRDARCEAEARRAFVQAFVCDADANGDALLDALAVQIGDAPALLITDNWEQVLDAAPLLTALLQRLPRLQAVALSRHPLEVEGERWLTLEPLPPPDADAPLETLQANPAVALFVDRAQAARPDFALTEANAPKVAELCRILEGAPLAIELAAAQLASCSLSQLLHTAHARLDWLNSRRRDVGYPYRSLQAALESSYALLSPPLRRAFATLAFLQGEWDATLADAVLGEPSAAALEELTRCSLLQRRWRDETPLYNMLEAVRLFGQRNLGGRDEAVQARLFSYFEQLGKTVRNEFNTAAQFEWLFRLRRLYPNLHAAMEWGVAHAPRRAATLVVDYGYFLDWEQRWEEGRRWCVRLLSSNALTRRQRARLLSWLGLFLLRMEQYEQAEAHLHESIRLCQTLRDYDELAGAYNMLALTLKERGRFTEAAEVFGHGVCAARRNARPLILAPLLNNWGALCYQQGRCDEAIPLLREAHALYRQIQTPLPLANTLNLLAVCHVHLGRYEDARACLEQALQSYKAAGYPNGLAKVYNNLADVCMRQGLLEKAEEWLEQARRVCQQGGCSLYLQGIISITEAQLRAAQGLQEEARKLLEQCRQMAHAVPALRQALEEGIEYLD